MRKFTIISLFGIGIITLVILFFLLGSWITMLVWNGLAGYFGFKTINFAIACLINLALWIVGGYFKSSSSKKS